MTRRTSVPVALVALPAAAFLLGLSAIGAQAPSTGDHAAHLKAWDAHEAMTQSSPYRTMNWSFLGPTNISGRIADVAVAERGSSRRFYAGSCCGGVWASDDLGQTWQAVFDQPNEKGFQFFKGWNVDAVAALRIHIWKPLYFEVEEKLMYVRYFGVNVDRGKAGHSLKANEFTFSFGWAFR